MNRFLNKFKKINEAMLACLVILIGVLIISIFDKPQNDNSFGFKCPSDFKTPEKYSDSLAEWINKYTKKYPKATAEDMMAVRDKLIEKNKCGKPPFTIDNSAEDVVNSEQLILPKQISWDGKVIAKLTYGRLQLSKLNIDDQYSQFIAEPTDTIGDGPWPDSQATKNIKTGDIVNITGKWESLDRDILPRVMIEKIKQSTNKPYIFKNLGFSFQISNNYYPLIGTDDMETIAVTSIGSFSDKETEQNSINSAIIIVARENPLDATAIDWLKSEYSGYDFSNGYKEGKVGGMDALLLHWKNKEQIDGVLFLNPAEKRRITISMLGDTEVLVDEFNKIVNTFSFGK